MEKTKTFYSRTTEVWNGTYFRRNEYSSYYENRDTAMDAFEREQKNVYNILNEKYDSAGIIVKEEYLLDGTRACRITGMSENKTDVVVVRLKELKMICE